MVSYIIIIGHHGLLSKQTQYHMCVGGCAPRPPQSKGWGNILGGAEGRGSEEGNASLDWSP